MNQRIDPDLAGTKIEAFLQTLIKTGGLNLKFQILACNGQVQPISSDPAGEDSLCLRRSPHPLSRYLC